MFLSIKYEPKAGKSPGVTMISVVWYNTNYRYFHLTAYHISALTPAKRSGDGATHSWYRQGTLILLRPFDVRSSQQYTNGV